MKLVDIPDKLPIPFANAGGKNAIPVESQIGIAAGRASLTDGFPPLTRTNKAAGGIPPFGTDMNGILYEMSAIDRWNSAGGGYPYDSDFAADISGYPKGAKVLRSDSQGYWLNTVDDNTTDPEAGGAGWVPDYAYGAAAITMTNSNVTLTTLQAGRPIVVITGLLTSNLNLILPTFVKNWTVLNKTTGAFTITAKTSGGAGVLVTQGTSTAIMGDGTDIFKNEAAITQASVVGLFKNLNASSNGANANVSVTADEIVLEDSSNQYLTARSVSLTISIAASGVNGLDTGTSAGSTWYSVWIISNGSTAAGLLSASATSPTLPSGYTYKARVGWIRTDGTANKYPLSFKQAGRKISYVSASGTNVTKLPTMVSGIQGSSPSTFVSVSTVNFVPPTAIGVRFTASDTGSLGQLIIAPNSSYSFANGIGVGGNPAPFQFNSSGSSASSALNGEIILESSNIFVILSSAGAVVNCIGWEENF